MLNLSFKKWFLFLDSDTTKLKNRTIFYFALLFLITTFSLLFSLRYLNRYPDQSLFDVRPLFGQYIKNLVQEGSYYYKTDDGKRVFYALYVPLIPYFMAAIARIYNSVTFGFFAKNLVAALLVAYAFKITFANTKIKMYAAIAALFFICLIPYNLNIMIDIDHEEGYNWSLILVLFSLICSVLFKEKLFHVVMISILIAALILTKSSHVYLCIFLTIYLFIKLKSSVHKFIPVGFTLAAFLLWGTFTYTHTGYFASLNNMSSWNGRNLYKGNNEYTLKYYPKYHVDMLNFIDPLLKTKQNFSNEWEESRFFEAKAKKFILDNPLKALDLAWRKAIVFFIDVRENNVLPYVIKKFGDKSLLEKAMFHGSMIVNRLLLFLAIALSGYYAFFTRKFKDFKWQRQVSLLYLSIVILYALPYIVGHNNYRHVVPLIPMTVMFLIWIFSEKNKNSLPT